MISPRIFFNSDFATKLSYQRNQKEVCNRSLPGEIQEKKLKEQ